jgi:hypothetical protein
MRGIFGRPFLLLDDLVPLDLLDEEGIDLELATANRYNNVWGAVIPKDPANYYKPPDDASERVLAFYEQHKSNPQAIQNFSKLAYGAYSPTWVVRLTDASPRLQGLYDKSFQMSVDDSSLWHPHRDTFPSVWKFIDQGEVFESTGRINFFITDHHCHTPEHTDYQHDQSSWSTGYKALAEKEFLWISLKRKDFYVLDDEKKVKHPVYGKCAWFNTLDRHGGDAVSDQTWSLRIDGVFTQAFRENLRQVFGDGKSLDCF